MADAIALVGGVLLAGMLLVAFIALFRKPKD